ncbi:MAG: hypothetical protein ABJA66_10430 [Actinomycetota bacterium]
MTIRKEVLDELIKGYKNPEDLLGEHELLNLSSIAQRRLLLFGLSSGQIYGPDSWLDSLDINDGAARY